MPVRDFKSVFSQTICPMPTLDRAAFASLRRGIRLRLPCRGKSNHAVAKSEEANDGEVGNQPSHL